MLGWLLVNADRYGRSDSRTVARRLSWLPEGFIPRLQRAKLVRTLKYVYRHSAAQRRLWAEAGVRPGDLRSPDVLTRIPFCDRRDLALHPENYICVPPDRLTHVITTSGTTGQAKKLYFTTEDLERQARMIGTKLCRLPGASRVMALYSVEHPTWSSGAMARRGIEKAGLFGMLVGTHKQPQEMIDLIKEYRIDTLMSVTAFAHRLTFEAKEDLRTLGVRYLLLGGQPWSESLRQQLEEAWGAVAMDVYGTNECACGIASECEHKDGLHISEADFWIEILDPKTGSPQPDGEEGEIVITTLSREGMPLVRYRTGDLGHILPEHGRCACGMAVRKLSRIRGRLDDMLIIGNANNVFPDEFDQVVLAVPGVSDYQVIMEKEAYKDLIHLTAEAENDTPELRQQLVDALMKIKFIKAGCESSGTVKIGTIQGVPRGTLSCGRPKAVRIVDRRS